MTLLVGINGFKRSGKGEAALALNSIWPAPEEIVYGVGFADKLKIMAALALGFERPPRDLIALMDEAKEEWDMAVLKRNGSHLIYHELSGREYLQNFGNQARNQFGANFWIDQVLPVPCEHVPGMDAMDHDMQNQLSLSRMYPSVAVVAITDLRYTNEAERVKALGGVVWEVKRPGVASDGHASEQPLPRELVDWTINNAGTLDDLEEAVAQAMEATL